VLEIGKSEDDQWLFEFVKTRTRNVEGFKGIDIETFLVLEEIKYT